MKCCKHPECCKDFKCHEPGKCNVGEGSCSKEYRRGYLTIELAMLMPGLMAVFIIIIFTTYFVHDTCLIKKAASRSLSADNPVETFESALEAGLYAKWDVDAAVTKRETIAKYNAASEYCHEPDYIEELVLTADCRMTSMQGMLADYISDEFFSVHIEEAMSNITGPDYIRRHKH